MAREPLTELITFRATSRVVRDVERCAHFERRSRSQMILLLLEEVLHARGYPGYNVPDDAANDDPVLLSTH